MTYGEFAQEQYVRKVSWKLDSTLVSSSFLVRGGQTIYKQIIMFVTEDTHDRAATYYRESSHSLSSADESLLNPGLIPRSPGVSCNLI